MDLITGDEVGLIKRMMHLTYSLGSEITLGDDSGIRNPPLTAHPWTRMNKDEAVECIALDKEHSRVRLAI